MTLTAERAARRAMAVYPSSPGLRSAFEAGAAARRHGRPATENPYSTRLRYEEGRWRRVSGWRAVWRTAWARGYTAR